MMDRLIPLSTSKLVHAEHFTILNPQNPPIVECYEVQKRRSTDLKLWSCYMFGREVAQLLTSVLLSS